ncbi:hypothetical protein ES703_13123 [subsurface metagenome]
MTEQYLRKLQVHGTGKQSRIPPEVCNYLEMPDGGDLAYELGPGRNVVTMRKAGTAGNGEDNEQTNAAAIERGQHQANSPMNPEKTITLFFSKPDYFCCIISGKRGCGKMSLAKKFCQDHRRIIVYDTLGEYTQGVVTKNLREFENFWAKVQHGNFRIIYRPLDPEREFDSICELVNESEDLTFLIEHLDWYCESSLPLKKLIRNGCDQQIELIGTTENPQAIDERLTSNAEQIKLLTSDTEQIYQLVSSPTRSGQAVGSPES